MFLKSHLKKILRSILPYGLVSVLSQKSLSKINSHYRSISYCDGVLNFKIDSHAGQCLINEGVYELHIHRLMKACIRPESNVIDIGANIGIHSIFMAQIIDELGVEGHVFAFEPVEHIRNELCVNQLLSGKLSKKIVISPYAVGDKNSRLPMICVRESEFDQGASSIIENEYLSTEQMRRKVDRYDVDVVRLDDFIIKNEIDNISFIKIDIEGYEFEALSGMQEILKEQKPTLIVEYNIDRIRHRLLDHDSFKPLLKDYRCFEVIRGDVSGRDLFSLEPFYFDRDVRCDLLCLPL